MTAAAGARELGRRGALAALLLLAAGIPVACADEAPPRVLVFAASSLEEVFGELVRAFERERPGALIELHCAGTPTLVLQVREGAPAALIAAADEESLAPLVGREGAAGEAVAFAHNAIALLTPRGNPRGIRGLTDLARPGLTLLLCGPEVPAGRYARRALRSAGVPIRSASDEPSVGALLAKLARGEADAGLAYASDALAWGASLTALPLAAAHQVRTTYPSLLLAPDSDPRRGRAEAFQRFLAGERARAILSARGFRLP